MVTASVETYFWIVDRLQIDDDYRNKIKNTEVSGNKVNKSLNTVTLSKPFLKRIENGHYIGRLMLEMQDIFEQRTGKNLSIPGELTRIDGEEKPWNKARWEKLFDALEVYGITLSQTKRDITISTSNTDTLLQLLDGLFEIDNSPNGTLSAAAKRKLEIKVFKTPLKQNSYNPNQPSPRLYSAVNGSDNGKLSEVGVSQRKGSVQGGSRPNKPFAAGGLQIVQNKNNEILKAKQFANASPSLGSLVKSPDRNQGIILGNEAQLANISGDQLDQLLPQTLEQAQTSVQFILMSISMGFDMKPKQASTLLTNNNQYLTHLCVRGAKGADFEHVKRWYNLIYPATGKLIYLINTEKKDVLSYGAPDNQINSNRNQVKQNRGKILFKTFNILKAGLYSRDSDVQMICGMVFLQLIKEINATQSDIIGDAWDWFTTSTMQPEFKRGSPGRNDVGSHLAPKSGKKGLGKASSLAEPNDQGELESLQYQTGLQALTYAYESNLEFLDLGVEMILHFGRANSVELFTQRMQQQLPNWSVYATFCNDIFIKSLNTPLAGEVIEQSGVLRYWIMSCLRVAESNNEVPLNDRIVSLVFLTDIWLGRPQFVESAIQGAADSIMRILKKAARDVRRTLTIIALELMFRLLLQFASEKHNFAPTLYKTLTFLLVEFYWETDVREIMLKHFIELYQGFDSIPINILCEPLLKQIEISQYHSASFNVFDFEFFKSIATHKRLTISSATLLIDSLTKIALSSVFYYKSAVAIIQTLIIRYQNEFGANPLPLIEYWNENIRNILQTLVNIQARIAIHKHHLKNEENNFFNRLALRQKKNKEQVDPSGGRMADSEYTQVRINEKLIVEFLEKVIQTREQSINDSMRTQLVDTHIAIQTGLKVDCKAIRYLLRHFTPKIDDTIERRINQNPNAAKNVPIPYIQELQQIQHEAAIQQPGAVDLYKGNSSPQMINKAISQRSISPGQLQGQHHQASVIPVNSPGQIKKTDQVPSQIYEYQNWEEEWEIKQYQTMLKKHNRLFKELHHIYSNQAAKKPLAVEKPTFDEKHIQVDKISSASVIKMIKDFQLQNGLQHQYLKQEVNTLVKNVNIYVMKEPGTVQDLTFAGFENFMLQYAYQLFGSFKAFQLIEKLINRMREHSQFNKLGLTKEKQETTQRKNVEILEKLENQIIKNGQAVPQNHKIKEERQTVVEYSVPKDVPMRQSKRVVVEVLDEILSNAFGFHFLEPVATEKVVTRVVPNIISRRKASLVMQSPRQVAQPKGVNANMPLSNQPILSQEAEERKQAYEQARSRGRNNQSEYQVTTQGTEYTNNRSENQKLNFKAQALNRRAKQFTDGMQLEIIRAPAQEKQNMFEAAEVLMEVVKAVEKGKQKLRIDYTPYRLYDMRKRSAAPPESVIEETEQTEVDPEERQRKKEAIQRQLDKQKLYLAEQRQKQAVEQERKQRNEARKEQNKQKLLDEYLDVQNGIQKDNEKKKKEELKLKLAADKKRVKDKVEEKEEAKKKEKQDHIKEKIREYKKELKQQQNEISHKKQEKEDQEEQKKHRKEERQENAGKIHKQKQQEAQEKKEQARGMFFTWCKSAPITKLLNTKYKKGLYVKYLNATEMSGSTTGVNQQAWLEFIKAHNLNHMVDPKALIAIHNRTVKEIQEVKLKEYQQTFKVEVKQADLVPTDRELHYGGFCSALVKVANFRHFIQESKAKFASQRVYDDYSEYLLVDQSGTAFEDFLKFMKVAEKK